MYDKGWSLQYALYLDLRPGSRLGQGVNGLFLPVVNGSRPNLQGQNPGQVLVHVARLLSTQAYQVQVCLCSHSPVCTFVCVCTFLLSPVSTFASV